MLWDLFKDTPWAIYLDSMEEDLSNMPDNFVVMEEHAYDEPFKRADGQTKLRKRSFNIRLHFVDTDALTTAIDAYRQILDNNNINYDQSGPIRDIGTKYHSALLTGTYIYG